ncbi:MAG: adenine phosphoribosyltransferase [Candidatus Poribacteria bacterium]|nr:adenine phosphoribosyltransferase [Candidatus Poribacteria bacterium]MDE0502872.1 adenine phosphoribosyltransferase [Candidatus Poribacteria bacterium]
MTDFLSYIRDVPDFPKPGIAFKDITPLLQSKSAFRDAIEVLRANYQPKEVDVVVGIDARGFILGGALAHQLGVGFVPVRKSGKLPYHTYEAEYDLEYGTDTLAIHQDAFVPGSRVLICDDVIATGGTIAATIELVEKLQAEVIGIGVLIELTFLNGREKFEGHDIFSLIEF